MDNARSSMKLKATTVKSSQFSARVKKPKP